jgi:ribosomal protein S4
MAKNSRINRRFVVRDLWPNQKVGIKLAKTLNKQLSRYRRVSSQPFRRAPSAFSQMLRVRRLVSSFYGNLRVSVLKNLYNKSKKNVIPGLLGFLTSMERRVDTSLVRIHFCPTHSMARQWILQGKVLVNDKPVIRAGMLLKPGDILSLAPNAFELATELQKQRLEAKNVDRYLAFKARRKNKWKSVGTSLPYSENPQYEWVRPSKKTWKRWLKKGIRTDLNLDPLKSSNLSLVNVNSKNFKSKAKHKSQKNLVLGLKLRRPPHFEISYRIFKAVLLYSPERVRIPASPAYPIPLNLLPASLRSI